jgi:DNA-binding protein Fis
MNSQNTTPKPLDITVCTDTPLVNVIKEVERLYLEQVLTLTAGNKRKAAEIAGLSHETFRKKVARYTVQTVYSLA